MVKSLKSRESNKILTALNIMTGVRFAGGIALGTVMAFGNVNPRIAAGLASGLIGTDAESSFYKKMLGFPRFQKFFRINPSKLGRLADPIVDKVIITNKEIQ